ncbi:MAG: MFS transporter [Actinomycetaceae bacterium]|nr:MFS transporter [Actinomycetaceae bacterium]
MSATKTDVTHQQKTSTTLLGTGVGNALEWFDWTIYATFAVYISQQLFDDSHPASAFLLTMAVFAVGFIARPFGGFLFGWLADRIGRKQSLTTAVMFASAGSLMIAVCPPYASFGVLASAFLLLARLIQGLAHGGELPSAQTYLAEQAPRKKRGLWASTIYITGTIGIVAGISLGLALNQALNVEQMETWGWRIPFLLGGIFGLFALWMRSRMDESEIFEEEHDQIVAIKENVVISVARNWRTALQVIGMTSGLTVAYYVWAVVMPSAAQNSFGYSANESFVATIIANLVFIIALPLWGWASDYIGRKPTMLISLIGNAVMYLPLFWWMEQSKSIMVLIIAVSIQLVLLAAFLGHAPATYAEMFTTDQRASGFGIPYAIAIACFGGTAGYIMAWMNNNTHFALYSIVLLCISAATVLTLPETKGKYLDHDVAEES